MNIKALTKCSLFTALICISSFIRIPLFFTPIPITLQLVFIYIAGAVLGANAAAVSVLIYVFLGIIGLPVFSGMNSGFGYILGPTGGFLIGFVPTAFLVGKLSGYFFKPAGKFFLQFASLFVSMALATLVLYFFGALHFSLVTNSSLQKAMIMTILPFVWIDLVKICVAAYVSRQLLLFFE